MTGIDWSSAPEWAKWVARDASGKWWWHSRKPELREREWFPRWISEHWTQIERANIRCNQHWMLSLTKRPKGQEMTQTTDQERAEPIKMQPGDDLHLTMLMAPHGLNFVTGKDREHLLAWGRDVWQAARRAQVVPQGWKLVPVEPTMEMVEAGDKSHKASSWLIGGANAVPATYTAMLASAPQPPAEQQAAHKSALGDEGKALAALRYYMHECSGAEPGISVFHRMAEEALEAAAPQPPESNSAEFDRIEAAPVQMPEAWGVAVGDRIWVGRPPAHVPKIAEHEGLPLHKLYTEHQVRQLLATQEPST